MNGLLLVDKEPGFTSHDVVAKVRRILGIRAIGHAGTLDPMASGLLLLMVGQATKLSDYLLTGDKEYEATVRIGLTTDSYDRTGQVKTTANIEQLMALTEAEILSAAKSLVGQLNLPVPVFSAVKVDGRRLYESAHRGEVEIETPIREMNFKKVEILGLQRSEDGVIDLKVYMSCSKGSFVRSWAHELGQIIGCGAVVQELRRTGSSPFKITGALRLSEIDELWQKRERRNGEVFGDAWIDLKNSLPHFQEVTVSGHDSLLLRNGQISKGVQARLLSSVKTGENLLPVRVIDLETNSLLALLAAQPGEFYKIRRVFS